MRRPNSLRRPPPSQRGHRDRPLAEAEQIVALDAVFDHVRPKLFRDEGHERMQHFQYLIERPRRHGARLGLCRLVVAGKQRLDQLEIPVAELPQTNS